ncbi:hypothetical protein BJX96DRAFT_30604 [Aspergillus floccosus]
MCSCMPGIRASCKYVWAAITRKQITNGSSTGRGSSGNRYPLKASQDSGGRMGQDSPFKEIDSSPRRYSLSGGRPGQFIRLKEIDPVYERQGAKNDTVLAGSTEEFGELKRFQSFHRRSFSRSYPAERRQRSQEGLTWLSDGDS